MTSKEILRVLTFVDGRNLMFNAQYIENLLFGKSIFAQHMFSQHLLATIFYSIAKFNIRPAAVVDFEFC